MAKKIFKTALIATLGIALMYFLLNRVSVWLFDSTITQSYFTLISTFVGIFVIAYYGMKGEF